MEKSIRTDSQMTASLIELVSTQREGKWEQDALTTKVWGRTLYNRTWSLARIVTTTFMMEIHVLQKGYR